MPSPTENQYIDLHTHIAWNYPYIFSVRSLVKPGEIEKVDTFEKPVSIGIHPWYIKEESLEEQFQALKDKASLSQVIAIGECGLDLKSEMSYSIQEKVFLKQAELAEEIKKPMVIHCVRAYQQMGGMMKQLQPAMPWIFHGFNHTEQVAEDLSKSGAYFSIGSDVLKENSKIRKSLRNMPLDRLFLETDDSNQPVWKIYTTVARMLSMTDKALMRTIRNNYLRCFENAG